MVRQRRRAPAALCVMLLVALTGCSTMDTSGPPTPFASEPSDNAPAITVSTEAGLTLIAEPRGVAANAPITLTATLKPAQPGAQLRFQRANGDSWENIGVSTVDADGHAALTATATETPGVARFRVRLLGLPETQELVSQPVVVEVTRSQSTLERVRWPGDALAYCQSASVGVTVQPPTAGRVVDLQASPDGTTWRTVTTARTTASGGVQLALPDCASPAYAAAVKGTWRVSLRPSGSFSGALSQPTRIAFTGPPLPQPAPTQGATCPKPRTITALSGGTSAVIANPSDSCSMLFVLRGGVMCDYGGGTSMSFDDFVIGGYQLEPSARTRFAAKDIADRIGALDQCRTLNTGTEFVVRFVEPPTAQAYLFATP